MGQNRWMGDLTVTYVDGKTFEVYNPNREFGCVFAGIMYFLPHRMCFDFASIPWLFRRVLERVGQRWCPYGPAAAMHDAWYGGAIKRPGDGSRKATDLAFFHLMQVPYRGRTTPRPVARIMYVAVRLGGWKGWVDLED